MTTGWSGPWHVTKVINELVYEIKSKMENCDKTLVVSIDRIRLYLKDEDSPVPLPTGTSTEQLKMNGNEFLTTIPRSEETNEEEGEVSSHTVAGHYVPQ